jgi:hypothetical protein
LPTDRLDMRPTSRSADSETDALSAALLRGRSFTARQRRQLRKEILLLRAALERAEVAEAGAEIRRSFQSLHWLKSLLPAWAGGKRPGTGAAGALSGLLSDHPLLASLVSFAVSRSVRRLLARAGGPAAKAGAIALAGWTLWKTWRAVRTPASHGADDEDATQSDFDADFDAGQEIGVD